MVSGSKQKLAVLQKRHPKRNIRRTITPTHRTFCLHHSIGTQDHALYVPRLKNKLLSIIAAKINRNNMDITRFVTIL